MLASSPAPLESTYDLAMLDLDGVVYVSGDAVPGAPEHLARARAAGMRCAYVTNNASRPPGTVVAHLRDLGIELADSDVVTSAQAAASVLRAQHGEGAEVLVLGGEGLWQAVEAAGLHGRGVDDLQDAAGPGQPGGPVALVTGYGPEVLWRQVMRAAVLLRDGLPWVASNTDLSIPTSYGTAPGHGVLVDTLRRFAGVEPTVAGKPARPLLDETVARVGGERPLMVGDRLDTDIEGGTAVGVDTLLVLTGVTGLAELVAASPSQRPTFVSADLGGLHEPHQAPGAPQDDGVWRHQGWAARTTDGRLEVDGDGPVDAWWQVVASAAWSHLDATGEPVATDALQEP